MRKFILNFNLGWGSIYGASSKEIKQLTQTINSIMATVAELSVKVDALQVALDAEQEQVVAAIGALEATVAGLQQLLADGGTVAERQAIADKLDAIIVDLKGTIADEAPAPVEPVA